MMAILPVQAPSGAIYRVSLSNHDWPHWRIEVLPSEGPPIASFEVPAPTGANLWAKFVPTCFRRASAGAILLLEELR